MKLAALFTVAFLSWQAASLALPTQELDLEAKKSLLLSEGAEAFSPERIDNTSPDKHMEKRAFWKNWAPSSYCVRDL